MRYYVCCRVKDEWHISDSVSNPEVAEMFASALDMETMVLSVRRV